MGTNVKDAADFKVRVWGCTPNNYSNHLGKLITFEYKAATKEDAENYAANAVNQKSWPTAFILEGEINVVSFWVSATPAVSPLLTAIEPLSERVRTAGARRIKEKQLQDLRNQMEILERDIQKMP